MTWYKYIVDNTQYLLKKTENNKTYIEGITGYISSFGQPPSELITEYIFDHYEHFKEMIFGLFQVDLENLFKMKHIFYQKLRLQSSEIENMPYYEYEYTVVNLKEWLEKEKEANEKENDSSKQSYSQKTFERQQKDMMKNYGSNSNYGKGLQTPKMPSAPSMPKMPSLKF